MRMLSVIVPAFNEALRLRESVSALRKCLDGERIPHEILLVNDGSRDKTSEVIQTCAAGDQVVRALGYTVNRGKGAAVAEGIRHATGDVMIFIDADLAVGIDGFLSCVKESLAGAPIVIGSKYNPGSRPNVKPPFTRKAASKIFRTLVRIFLRLAISDTQCGLKAFNRPSAEILFALRTVDSFAFDAELLVIARRNGIPIKEVPVSWSYSSESSVRVFGSGSSAVRDLVRVWWRDLRGRYRSKAGHP